MIGIKIKSMARDSTFTKMEIDIQANLLTMLNTVGDELTKIMAVIMKV